MKPMHANVTKLSRCPCCQSSYRGKPIVAKKAARAEMKRELIKIMKCE